MKTFTEGFKIGKNFKQREKIKVENTDELIKVIQKLIKERGKDANLNDIDVSNITDMCGLFMDLNIGNIDVSTWDVSNVVDFSYMFADCKEFNGDLSNWEIKGLSSNKIDTSYMFEGCYEFEGKGLSNWDMTRVSNIAGMFRRCENININELNNWKFNKDVKMSKSTFRDSKCSNDNKYPSWFPEKYIIK